MKNEKKKQKIVEMIVLLPICAWVLCVTIGGFLLGIKGLQALGKKKAAESKQPEA